MALGPQANIEIVSDGTPFGTRLVHLPSGTDLTDCVTRSAGEMGVDGFARASVTFSEVAIRALGKVRDVDVPRVLEALAEVEEWR